MQSTVTAAHPASPNLFQGIDASSDVVSLAGEWNLCLGEAQPDLPPSELPNIRYTDSICLPATTETARKGPLNPARETWGLTRLRKFEGPAWYQREIEVPAAWARREIILILERTKYTQVWLDDRLVGSQAIFGSPQRYELGTVTPGKHSLTILVDNRPERWPARGWDTHQFSDNTQTNWNGIIGRIELRALRQVGVEDVSITSDVPNKSFKLRVVVANRTGHPQHGTLTIGAVSRNHAGPVHAPAPHTADVKLPVGQTSVETTLALGDGARLWDEFEPQLYTVTVDLSTSAGDDRREITTGLRQFSGRGDTQFRINGRRTFLRGKHDACVFPLTGHPPMDVEGWRAYLSILKDWGFNHLRCHSWIPPEACFAAADELGIYVQPELPFWGIVTPEVKAGLAPEGISLLRACGNHPSFVMLSLGNELQGERHLLAELVAQLRGADSRVLFADGSSTRHWEGDEQTYNDWRTVATVPVNGKRVQVRGSFGGQFAEQGIVQTGDGSTDNDYSEGLTSASMPVIAHETGQFSVFPDLREIPKYTGVVQARNFEIYRDRLAKRGMLGQAHQFLLASGALAASLYKEDQERYLRTPGFGGFQVLDLQDFPGQGTALVGMFSALMENKGVTTRDAWRGACAPVSITARYDRCVWTTSQRFVAELELAHYGPADWEATTTTWQLVDINRNVVAAGSFQAQHLARGGVRRIGRIEVALNEIDAPTRLDLEVEAHSGAERAANQWAAWVCPEQVNLAGAGAPNEVVVAKAWTPDVERTLASGGRVLLIPEGSAWGETLSGGYATDYWSWNFFQLRPGTLGLLIDPGHAALKAFPTRFYAERQWAAITHASRPVVLTHLPVEIQPIVQVIDNPVRCERLGLIFEVAVGSGRLLVCAADLDALRQRPEACQLRQSLLAYASSANFNPTTALDAGTCASLLGVSLAQGRPATCSSERTPSAVRDWEKPRGFGADKAVDGDDRTSWQAADASSDQWLAVDLGDEHDVTGVSIEWDDERHGRAYGVEASRDGKTWRPIADHATAEVYDRVHRFRVRASGVRHIRVTIPAAPSGAVAGIRHLRVLGQQNSGPPGNSRVPRLETQ